jgi:hypothetical protein
MKERPILMKAHEVRAILAGTKVQTRRVVKPRKDPDFGCHLAPGEIAGDENRSRLCPYGRPGDRLWVREAWTTHKFMDAIPPRDLTTISIAYVADGPIKTGKYRQAFHMPRRYSRILLDVTAVRVERLQDISEADAKAEGVTPKWEPGCSGRLMEALGGFRFRPAGSAYAELWEQINGPGSWDANPWVWVVEFRRVEA